MPICYGSNVVSTSPLVSSTTSTDPSPTFCNTMRIFRPVLFSRRVDDGLRDLFQVVERRLPIVRHFDGMVGTSVRAHMVGEQMRFGVIVVWVGVTCAD